MHLRTFVDFDELGCETITLVNSVIRKEIKQTKELIPCDPKAPCEQMPLTSLMHIDSKLPQVVLLLVVVLFTFVLETFFSLVNHDVIL